MLRIIVLLHVGLLSVFLDAGSTYGIIVSEPVSPVSVSVEPDTLVLCPRKFEAAMKTWVDYRTGQGHTISVLSPAPTPFGIKKQIREVAQKGCLKNVLIVGDSGDHRSAPDSLVTTDYVAAKVNVRFGSDPEIATDNTYADLDDDGIPDLTIGRLPADSVEEIERLTKRIIDYETNVGDLNWQRRINLVAGVGGFGSVIDSLIEQTTKQIITDLVPGGYETTMTYGSWCSPYCPDPRRFSESAIARFNEGCVFWVYIGHGSRHQLDKVYMPDQSHRILDNETVKKMDCQAGNPIAIFLSCYTGATDDPNDCLAETMLRQENGPVAAICGTRVTMPYAMSLLSLEMVHEFFNGDAQTLGELTLLAKRRMVLGSNNNREYRDMIEGMGKTFSPLPKMLKLERLEHAQLIHLIGDPLLHLKRPVKIKIDALETSMAGKKVKINGDVPAAGILKIELSYQRDRLRQRFPRRREFDSSDDSFNDYQETYEQAQNLVCATVVIPVTAGAFETELVIPRNVDGRCVVRAMLNSSAVFALGSQPIEVRKDPTARSAKQKIEVELKR